MVLLWCSMMAVTLLIGFCIGLVTYRASRRWCDTCGAALSCSECAARRQPSGAGDPPTTH